MNTRDGLRRRVTNLEARFATHVEPATTTLPQMSRGELRGRLALVVAGYADWRHEALTLEELLALATDDVERATARRRSHA